MAYLIEKEGKPNIIDETLMKPAVLQLTKIMLEKEAEKSFLKYHSQMTLLKAEQMTSVRTFSVMW